MVEDCRVHESGELIGQLQYGHITFDELVRKYLASEIGAADALEKMAPSYTKELQPFKKQILEYAQAAKDKAIRWHTAQILAQLEFSDDEVEVVRKILVDYFYLSDSKIVQVNALQALVDLAQKCEALKATARSVYQAAQKNKAPSLQARARILKKKVNWL